MLGRFMKARVYRTADREFPKASRPSLFNCELSARQL